MDIIGLLRACKHFLRTGFSLTYRDILSAKRKNKLNSRFRRIPGIDASSMPVLHTFFEYSLGAGFGPSANGLSLGQAWSYHRSHGCTVSFRMEAICVSLNFDWRGTSWLGWLVCQKVLRLTCLLF